MIESNEYRSALRAVSQVSGADGGVSRPKLTIEELEGVITPEVCPFLIIHRRCRTRRGQVEEGEVS
jgi:hypothetical protein